MFQAISDPKQAEESFEKKHKEIAAASRLFEQELARIKHPIAEKVSAAVLAPLDGEVWPWPVPGKPGMAYVTNPEASSIFRTLVFLKHGVTFRALVQELENPEAHRKWMAVHRDFWRLQSGNASYSDLKLKFKLEHFEILVQSLDFGLDKLNEWELAQCLDEICPCAQKHSTEYLKKLRNQIRKASRSLIARTS
jgi:hypothetical protein